MARGSVIFDGLNLMKQLDVLLADFEVDVRIAFHMCWVGGFRQWEQAQKYLAGEGPR